MWRQYLAKYASEVMCQHVRNKNYSHLELNYELQSNFTNFSSNFLVVIVYFAMTVVELHCYASLN